MSLQLPMFELDARETITVARVVAYLERLHYLGSPTPSDAPGSFWVTDAGVELVSRAGRRLAVVRVDGQWTAVSEPVETMDQVEEALGVDTRPEPRRSDALAVLGQAEQGELPDPELEPWLAEAARLRPTTWGECQDRLGDGLCPFVSCRMHLWCDSNSIPLFERAVDELDPDDIGETCALRIADAVELRPSPSGKSVCRTKDAEAVVGHPRPTPILPAAMLAEAMGPTPLSPERWAQLKLGGWQELPPEERNPTQIDAAVIGRFLGLSREMVRIIKNRARRKFMADPVIVDLAETMDIRAGLLSDDDDDD